MAKNWVSQTELAEELNVSYQVVQNWIKRNVVRSKINKKTLKMVVDKTSVRARPYAKRKVKSKE